MTSYSIQGRDVTLPVRVRDASAWAAHWLVPAPAAQRLVPRALRVAEPVPGRAICSLVFVQYRDSDLDPYNELAVTIGVRSHDASPAGKLAKALEVARRDIAVYVRHMPVTQPFTLEAGRTIWGYPKTLAQIDIIDEGSRAICEVRDGSVRILRLTVHRGLAPAPPAHVPTYTDSEGVLRLVRWTSGGVSKGRPRGATLMLGAHPIADELRTLGLPTRATGVTTVAGLQASFDEAVVVSPRRSAQA